VDYFITGATGFVGRPLTERLLSRNKVRVHLLCRDPEAIQIRQLQAKWGRDRVIPVSGDVTQPSCGLPLDWVDEHNADITHFFHLAEKQPFSTTPDGFALVNVTGTENALELAKSIAATHFHHLSSISVSGDFDGVFDETMLEEGQRLHSSYAQSKLEAEILIRRETDLDCRVYRPAVVVGHSETGEIDRPTAPYYFFPALKALRDMVPNWAPLVGMDFGDTNIIPIDYVVSSIDHLAHQTNSARQTFHLANPTPQSLIEISNDLAAAARAPQFAVPFGRQESARSPIGLIGQRFRPTRVINQLLRNQLPSMVLDQTVGRMGLPSETITNAVLTPVIATRRTRQALLDSGLEVPPFTEYAENLWTYWEEVLDDSVAHNSATIRALQDKTVLITGASSGIGFATAAQVAKCGAQVVLVARSQDKLDALQATIERLGGRAATYSCDLSDLDSVDDLASQLLEDFDRIDFVINNAGRSIRRSIELSSERFHDFERTMQLNYFGTIRLVMGLMPGMRTQGGGHIVNISSVGVLGRPPRFSAYIASKAALDAWTDVAASEAIRDNITFTTIHMPLVRTPMISPTKAYNTFSTISPGQAVEKIIEALVKKPREINTLTGTTMALVHQVAPSTALRLLNLAYQSIPEPGMRPSDHSERTKGIVRSVYQKLRW
jgi:NAD(P)-dependent dehydrogenase (short-subunit alcohol dehydrogenase family)